MKAVVCCTHWKSLYHQLKIKARVGNQAIFVTHLEGASDNLLSGLGNSPYWSECASPCRSIDEKYWWEVLMMLLSSCLQVKRLEACELLDSNIISVKYFYLSVRIQYLNVYACISFDNYHSANHGYLGSISLISVVCSTHIQTTGLRF